jgi:hypothetical protein
VYDTNNGGGDDSKDLIILDEEVSKSNKGKAIEVIHQILVCNSCYLSFLPAD